MIKLLVGLVATLYLGQTNAQTTWFSCGSCSTVTAEQMAVSVGPYKSVVVFDPVQKSAIAFDTSQAVVGPNCHESSSGKEGRTENGYGCSFQTIALVRAMHGAEASLRDALVGWSDLTGGTMKTTITLSASELGLPPGPITGAANGSAFDVMNSWDYPGRVRTSLQNSFNNTLTMLRNVHQLAAAAGASLLMGADATSLTVIISFEDGTQVAILLEDNSAVNEFRGFDSQMREIITAENVNQFVAQSPASFGSGGEADHVQRTLEFLSIPVSGSSGSSFSCVPIDDGTGVLCRRL